MEKQETQLFNFGQQQVRAVLLEEEAWFVGKDVAEALGYKKPENAISSHVEAEDKTTTLIQGTGSNYKSNTVLINESGLYSLILKSKLPSARKFKQWVTSEVLPSIRKTGSYNQQQSNYSPQIQFMDAVVTQLKQNEIAVKQLEAKVDSITQTVAVNIRNDWRKQTHLLVNAIAGRYGSNMFGLAKSDIYREVEARAGVNLQTRLSNMKQRSKAAGYTAVAVQKLNTVDVIAADKKLIEIYITVVKEFAIEYNVYQNQLEHAGGNAA